MRWVQGVSIGDEGHTFWPWHRDRAGEFRLGHHRIGGAVVATCTECGLVLAAGPMGKGRKSAAVTQHSDLHLRLETLEEQVAHLNETLGIDTGDTGDDTAQGTESGYFEPSYDVRETRTGPDNGDDGGQ